MEPFEELVRAACVRCLGTKCPLLTAFFLSFSSFFDPPPSQTLAPKNSAGVDGGPCRVLSVRRHRSEDPHRCQRMFFSSNHLSPALVINIWLILVIIVCGLYSLTTIYNYLLGRGEGFTLLIYSAKFSCSSAKANI